MVQIRGSKRLSQKVHEKLAAKKDREPQSADRKADDQDDVLDPDPIKWALPADGKSVHKGSSSFSEVQLVHMYHLGHMVGWSLEKYHNDRTILTQICEKIGISRDQFRGFVYSKKFKFDHRADCPTLGCGKLNDEGGSSTSD